MKKILQVFLILLVLFTPVFGSELVYAQGDPGGGDQQNEDPGGGNQGGGQPTVINFEIPNPLKAQSLQCLLYDVINGVINVLAIVAALYIIYSGFMFVAAQGKPAEIDKARKAFFNAIIGTAILLGAWAITSFLVNVVNDVVADAIPGLPDSGACE